MENDIEVWWLECPNAYALRDYFFPNKELHDFSICEEIEDLEKIENPMFYMEECAKRIAREKGAKIVLILFESRDLDWNRFILDPNPKATDKAEEFLNNLHIAENLDCDELERIIWDGPYDNEFVSLIINKDVSGLKNYCRKLKS